jgi:hypothetical protein
MTEDNVITGMIAACKSGYVSLESGCIIDTTWEAKLSKSVFAPQPNGRHASSSYVMLWNETDVSKPMSFQIELTSGLSCRVAIRPTFWPKEAHAFITFTENNANPSIFRPECRHYPLAPPKPAAYLQPSSRRPAP